MAKCSVTLDKVISIMCGIVPSELRDANGMCMNW